MARRMLPLGLVVVAVLFAALLGQAQLDLGPACASHCGDGTSLERRDLDRPTTTACLRADRCGGGAASASGWTLIAPEAGPIGVLAGLSLVLVVGFARLAGTATSLDPAGRLFRPPRLAG